MCALLIEDKEQVGAFVSHSLQELGFESFHAVSVAQALDELSRNCHRFHVVFSDVVMPGISWLELGQEIRRLHPDMPVVLTSGYGNHDLKLLHKPCSVEQISRVLRKAPKWQADRHTTESPD